MKSNKITFSLISLQCRIGEMLNEMSVIVEISTGCHEAHCPV